MGFFLAFRLWAGFCGAFSSSSPFLSLPFAHQRFGGVGGAVFLCFFGGWAWALGGSFLSVFLVVFVGFRVCFLAGVCRLLRLIAFKSGFALSVCVGLL